MKKRTVMNISNLSISLFVVLFLLITGCLDYKAYDVPQQNSQADLVDEIAQVEEQLRQEEELQGGAEVTGDVTGEIVAEAEENIAEEVVLPELGTTQEVPSDIEYLETVMVKENELVRLKIRVTDPDKDLVTYTFSKPLNKEGEWKTSYGDAGEYIVTITATDGVLTTEKKVKIVVERVNVPPVIEALRDITVREGDTVEFTPKVSDPNKDEFTVTVSEPLQSGTFVTDHTSAGEYQITVTGTDGELASTSTFRLMVQDVNVVPEISNLPESLQVKEGDVVRLNPVVTDLDNDAITITISDPVGEDGVWETSYTDHGIYQVTVTITDGKDTVLKKVRLVVDDVNKPPMIEDVYLE